MQIYYLPIVSNAWEKKENLLLKYVSQKRQEKVLKYKYELDQKLSLYAALIVRMGISALTDICASDLQFSSQPNHKPFLLSDKNVDFNISHTQSAILCAISLNNSIGADIEKIHLSPPLEIMSQVFHPKEIQYINQSNLTQRTFRFFETWTKKEAYTKQMGIGLVEHPYKYNTLADPIASQLYSWKTDEYYCTVCGKEKFSPIIHTLTEDDIYNYYLT